MKYIHFKLINLFGWVKVIAKEKKVGIGLYLANPKPCLHCQVMGVGNYLNAKMGFAYLHYFF